MNPGRPLHLAALLGLACLAAPMPVLAQDAATDSAAREPLRLVLDRSQVVRLPEDVSTLVIGNPGIADAILRPQPRGLMVVTPKSYGSTNILALDSEGQVLRDLDVRVEGADRKLVVVQRGMARETWACTPRCEQTVTLGDNPEFFDKNAGQIGSRNNVAAGR
ncbi:pilus assembly protein N-terminal domain-containing protein [Terrihabitans sp. B22-R8]|uniref:pilus assembly protein N-terminal domain-containing protein n=1 Tax=Terrihabitans sp. B22-R8 TaxID=3425128 RepID=UPI00403C4290